MVANANRIKKIIIKCCTTGLFLLLTACVNRGSTSPLGQDTYYDLHKAADLNAELGLAYLQAGDIKRAKSRLLLAERQNGHNPFVQDAMGYFYENTGEIALAKTYYVKAIALSGGQGAAFNNYGTFLCRQKQYQSSLGYFLKAANDPNYLSVGQAYENAGTCALSIPNRKQARLYFEKAIAYDSKQANALLGLSKIDFAEHYYVAAQFRLDQFNQLTKPTPESLYLSLALLDKVG